MSVTCLNLVLTERLPGIIFTGFQESSHWRAETARYRELAGIAHQICIFAGGELPVEADQRQIHVRLRGADPLRQEWFLLVLTDRFTALLCGRDLHAPALSESDRAFDTLWSFEPEIIRDTLTLLRDVVVRERPDRLADLDDAINRFPVTTPDMRLLTMVTTRLIADIVHQHQARLRLERALAYESRLRALGQVVSGVAHELNNPLQSVLGFVSLALEEPELPANARDDLRIAMEAAERARLIVQDLLQLARPASEAWSATNIGALLQQTLIFVRSDLEANRITLTMDIAPNLPPVIINPTRIQQLLINLLSNAVQVLADRALPRQIQIVARLSDKQQIQIAIRDNGSGIPIEMQERIFEPFFTTKPVGRGTGLGLSIARTIANEHRGVLSVESQPGAGTVFYLALPVENATPTAVNTAAHRRGRGHVLVIDDDMHGQKLVQRMLERAGYTVYATGSAIDGLDYLAQRAVDLVISDVLMPDMDGVAFYGRLADRHPELLQRLIFITGDASRPTTRVFLQGAGAPYVLKPFTGADLARAINMVFPEADNPEVE